MRTFVAFASALAAATASPMASSMCRTDVPAQLGVAGPRRSGTVSPIPRDASRRASAPAFAESGDDRKPWQYT